MINSVIFKYLNKLASAGCKVTIEVHSNEIIIDFPNHHPAIYLLRDWASEYDFSVECYYSDIQPDIETIVTTIKQFACVSNVTAITSQIVYVDWHVQLAKELENFAEAMDDFDVDIIFSETV